jgi:hypothetical protein
VFAKGTIEIGRTILSLLRARLFRSAPTNAGDFARFWIGDRLYQKSGLANYLERFYGVEAEDIEIDFAKKRMGWISEKASFGNLFKDLCKSNKNRPRSQELVRPPTGFVTIYEMARRSLEQGGGDIRVGRANRTYYE